jgi:hypothetical protein
MSRVEQIEGQVKELSPDELRSFWNWFVRFDAEIWDQQIEADAKKVSCSRSPSAQLKIINPGARPFL